jgi:hypothetical protein
MEDKTAFSLKEIAEWDEKKKVSLPTVQRGFVWKANQIENLWDSLLRGYPVGAFVLSPAENNTWHILDGQQRATAICLGFAKETFRDSQDFYKVFIDLDLPKPDDNRKFIFRVITRSHPWGYRKQESNKTLTAENIRKAMDLYDAPDPLTAPLEKFFPYDAGFPVPFYFFINEALKSENASVVNLFTTLKKWEHWDKVNLKWINSQDEQFDKANIEQILLSKIDYIFNHAVKILDSSKGRKIPALEMNLDFEQDNQPEQEDAADEVENLFIRLNAGGTQLTGEELNYSILKAHLSSEIQDIIENGCKHLFKPARFITIAYRLYQQDKKEAQQADALTMRIKPKQFQRTISKQVKSFEQFLIDTIQQKNFDGKTLLSYAKHILAYNEHEQQFGLPYLLYSKISEIAPELMFLLLYRIKIKRDRFSNKNENEHRQMLGMLTLFLWFGKGENLKDHSKILSNIWPSASTLPKERFWSSETIERAHIEEVLLSFPAYKNNRNEYGIENILDYKITEKANVLNKFEKEVGEEYLLFMQKVIYNKDFLLYAQRSFIEGYFKKDQFKLEDTNVPFDWDHISPNRLVRNKKNILRIVRDWYQTNGNYRAWPYALNRMDSDNSPAIKLNPFSQDFDDENQLVELKQKWAQFIELNSELISDEKKIDRKLREWSFCEKGWVACKANNIRSEWKQPIELIIRRNILIIKEWYEELLIDSLKKEVDFNVETILDKRKWSKVPTGIEEFDNMFDDKEDTIWLSSPISISNSIINLYIYYSIGESAYLKKDGIIFGIYEKVDGNFIAQLEEKSIDEMDTKDFTWIESNFTLISSTTDSIKIFINEMQKWLLKLPAKKIDKDVIIANFNEMISSKFKFIE